MDEDGPSTYWHFAKIVHSTLRVPTPPGLPMEGLTIEQARQALELDQEDFDDLLDEFSDDQPAEPWLLMSIDIP